MSKTIRVYFGALHYKSETSISISPIYIYIYICPLEDLNKYTSDTSISMCPTGDKYK